MLELYILGTWKPTSQQNLLTVTSLVLMTSAHSTTVFMVCACIPWSAWACICRPICMYMLSSFCAVNWHHKYIHMYYCLVQSCTLILLCVLPQLHPVGVLLTMVDVRSFAFRFPTLMVMELELSVTVPLELSSIAITAHVIHVSALQLM